MTSQTGDKPGKAGRPRAQIDWKVVDEWLEAGCMGTSIANKLGINHETLYDACKRDHKLDFSEYSRQKKSCGEDLIRKTQYDVAIVDKNTTMLIWLGKQRCGQKEQHETAQASPETTAQLLALLQQIKNLQSSSLATDDKSNNTDNKS